MEQLTWMLAGVLRAAARLLPPGRRQWAEAVQAEAGQVPAGWPRLRWLAGGLWLVAREAKMVRKVVYWLGVGAVAAAAAWTVWLSWRASPAADPLVVTDRVRVLVGVAALVVLPWVGRRRGWFGPVGSSITARLVRVAAARRSAAWAWPSCGWTVTSAAAPMARARSACPARSPRWRCLAPRWRAARRQGQMAESDAEGCGTSPG